MESSAFYIAAASSLLLLLLLLRRLLLSPHRLPPSAPGRLPLIGHLHLLMRDPTPHVLLHRISRHHSWPLFSLQLGQQPVVVASTPAAAREILKAHDPVFANRPPRLVFYELHDRQDLFSASPSDPQWKLLRQLCSTHLFSKKRLDDFHPLRSKELSSLLRSILDSAGTPFDIRTHMQLLSINLVSGMVFGKRLRELTTAAQAPLSYEISKMVEEMNHLLFVVNLADCFPMFGKLLDLRGDSQKAKDISDKFDVVLKEIIDSRRNERLNACDDHSGRKPDFLDGLLQASSLTEKGTTPLSGQSIKGVLMEVLLATWKTSGNIFGGGIDTASLTVEYAMGELLRNPSKMLKLREELAQVVGMDCLVQEADLSDLPYLQAVVKETMRLHPVLPMLPHLASETCEVMGYQIPAKTAAFVNIWGIGRDPEVWQNPSEFNPERFVGSEIDVNGQHYELLPFGSGRRGCPGWTMGNVMVQIVLGTLVQAFDWEAVSEIDITEEFGWQPFPTKRLMLRASPRMQAHLLQPPDDAQLG